MCSAFNLTAVEEIFERTSLYTKVPASRLSEERHLKFLWMKAGDCRSSHDAVRKGKGFNLGAIQSDFCERLVTDPATI
jgi:hypothetical protein